MNFKLILCLWILFVSGESQLMYPGQINRGTIKFKLSAKNLPDKDPGFGTSDPYVELYYTENGASRETKIKRSETVSNTENPVWSTEFELNYDRTKNQALHFYLYDEDDFRRDDELGKAWLDFNDYMDKGQIAFVPIYKEGYLKVERLTLTAPTAPRNWLETQRIKFKLSATGLPAKDGLLGNIDPYAEIYSVEGISGKETKIGTTGTINNDPNPKWGEVFDYSYDAKKLQRLVIKIYDSDNFRRDERGGFGYVELEDYMRHAQNIVVNLSKGGKLSISRF